MSKKRALITGVSGQDGALLSHFLLQKDYEVYGTSRDIGRASFENLDILRIRPRVNLISMEPTDFQSVFTCMRTLAPDEVYHFAGQSSVGLSFSQPKETLESISIGTLNLLEAIRLLEEPIRFYSAGSGEMFGNQTEPVNERSRIDPTSPYGVAKATSFFQVNNYRQAYGLFACTGILFNHESPLRGNQFVTKKIMRAAARIASGQTSELELGNLDVNRDWGWAPEYVDAIWRMLQLPKAQDLIVASGTTRRLRDFLELTFKEFNLDWQRYVRFNASFQRPSDLQGAQVDPSLAFKVLDWRASTPLEEIVKKMAAFETKSNLDWL